VKHLGLCHSLHSACSSDFHTPTQNLTRIERDFHNLRPAPVVALYAMKQAFVLQLAPETETARRRFVGCIEEVDTGRELRFRSTDELLAFLAQCFDDAAQPESEPEGTLEE
jgi:hypothetical protein